MSRRKGTPCACESDPCGCGSSKGKCIRAINNVSPDPNGDFNVNAGAGIIIGSDENGIIISNGMPNPASLIAGDNIEINPSGDDLEIRLADNISITGDAVIGGDLTVNGTYYTVHAEHVYTEDDYIIMRDGATTGLGSGDFSGFQVKLYDGVNDGRLVIDNTGTARVGDVGDEQPLLTRDESADLTDGDILIWDATDSKAVGITPSGQIIRTTIDSNQTYAGTDVQLAMTLVTGDNDYFEITDAGTTITIKKAGNYILSYEVDIENIANNDVVILGYIGTILISLARSQVDANPYKNIRSTTIFSTTANTKIKVLFRATSGAKTSSLGHVELARL